MKIPLAILLLILHCSFSEGIGPKCVAPKCNVKVLTSEEHQHCHIQRQREVHSARKWYQVTDHKSPRGTIFPLTSVPWLNQTITNILGHYSFDDFESRWIASFGAWQKISEKIDTTLSEGFKSVRFENDKEFIGLRETFNSAIQNINPYIIGNPTMKETFTDHLTKGDWRTDEAFAQRRLAYGCPFTLRKVFLKGKRGILYDDLKKVLSEKIIGLKQVKSAIKKGRVFVQRLEDLDDMVAAPDKTPQPGKKLNEIVSPITVFILSAEGNLVPIAIQIDSKKDADVFTPADGDAWRIAKIKADSAQDAWCQSYIHLGQLHFGSTVYCLTFRRHLSEKHPLYDMMKFHCEGTIPHITTTYVVLTQAGSVGDFLFGFGNKGMVGLAAKGAAAMKYQRLSYKSLIKDRGLNDRRLKYYPFRDDAKVMLQEFRRFARVLVRMYYKSPKVVEQDSELNSWVKELHCGVAEVEGFPAKIDSKKKLQDLIMEVLWTTVIHATCNYAMPPIFVPTTATKTYSSTEGPTDPNKMFMNGFFAAKVTSFRGTLANFRINRIFDYHEKVKDKRFGEHVRRSYERMHGCVQDELAARNAERKKKNQLGYQYLEPIWLTNSIHI